MNVSLSIGLDILSAIFISIVLFNYSFRTRTRNKGCNVFSILIIMTLLFMLSDIAYLLLYGNASTIANVFSRIFKCLYFAIYASIGYLWLLYIAKKIYKNLRKIRTLLIIFTIPAVINIILVIINLFTDVLFSIGPTSIMNANPFFMWIFTAGNYCYSIFILFIIIANRRLLSRHDFISMIIFLLPPVICSGIQIFCRNVSLICGYAISEIYVYVNLQDDLINTDGLTGIHNRRFLSFALDTFLRQSNHKKYLTGIMLDVDNLKAINDQYGHVIGDKVLIAVATILVQSVDKDDIVARYAGDEFMIVTKTDNEEDVRVLINSIENNRQKYNQTTKLPYTINFSMGYYMCKAQDDNSVDSFLSKVDEAMYCEKREKKASKNNC